MAYTKGGKIEKDDINVTLVGPSSSTSSTNINTVWGTGSGKSGYGQTALANVPTNGTVNASDWANIINTINRIASHQGTAVTAYSAPVAGGSVLQLPALGQNITNINAGKNNASVQGTSVPITVTNATTWYNYLTFTHTVSFASGDAARYFFNAGGQLALTFGHPTGSGINGLFANLATACGTLVISGNNSGTSVIAGSTVNGVTKFGGSGTEVAWPLTQTSGWSRQSNLGYWGLSTINTEIFRQYGLGITGYTGSYISVVARVSSPTGPNGDNGATITITTTFDEVPNGMINSTGSSVTLTVRPPSTTYLTNTWGTVNAGSGQSIVVTGSVTGQ